MKKKIFALGFFDGVHLGHQALLTACRELAAEGNCTTAAITFDAHPQSMFTSEPPKLLTTLPDRIRLLRDYGMEQVITLPVTPEVMSTPWEQFLQTLVERGAAGFVCGNDFRFGHRGEGNAQRLSQFCKERALPCAIVEEQLLNGIRISSTHIRGLIARGDMAEAEAMLGHPHVLTGEVVHGKALGRTIGIPTANLLLPADVTCPAFGVYACEAVVEGKCYMAVTNVGVRPTVSGEGVTVEPWLLDFRGDLYGKELTLRFYAYLRPEQKFDSLGQLQAEIQKNAAQTREIFGRK